MSNTNENIALVNETATLANNLLICDEACEKEKKSKKLEDAYNKAKSSLLNGKTIYNDAEEDFIKFTKGESEYKRIIADRKLKTLNAMKDEKKKEYNSYIDDIRGYSRQYDTNYVYYKKIEDFYKHAFKENKKFKKDVGDYHSKVNVNNRKIQYQTKEIEQLQFVRIILLIVYYVTFCIILYQVDFINNEYYKNKYVLFGIILFVLFGIYVDKVSILFYKLTKKLYHIFENETPRNIYVNL